jgi:cell wall-associated NlpC family hydrolase
LEEQYLEPNILKKYIGKPHNYGIFDCISLIQQFYKTELGCDFDLPNYSPSRKWMTQCTTTFFDEWADKYGKKVSLTDAKNYDLISFKSPRSNFLMHFGLYIKPNKLLHIEEGKLSQLELLSDYWIARIYAIYRHDKLV